MRIRKRTYDVIVAGGGAAGVGAALSAARNGLKTLLVEAGSMVGGDLVSGLPWNGTINARGEPIIGGVAKKLWSQVAEEGGFAERVCDWRLMHTMCLDPVHMQTVIIENLQKSGLDVALYSVVKSVVGSGRRIDGVMVESRHSSILVEADWYIDCTGDGTLSIMAGAEYEKGGPQREFQPVSVVFRLSGVEWKAYLEFVRDNSQHFILGEGPVTKGMTKAQCALELYKQGIPFAGLDGNGPLLLSAISNGELAPCGAIYVCPNSPARKEVSINTTRVADIDGTDPENLSKALPLLNEQMRLCVGFLKKRIPGFENASLSGIASRIGIRETARIIGDYVLTEEDVIEGKKSAAGIAKGGHHIDVHGSGTYQKRIPVKDGNSYDIPYGCIVPKALDNAFMAGRCMSATREAHGSARNMGQCLATGEAAAVAAALCTENKLSNVREVSIPALRERLKAQGGILDGTH